MYFFIDIKFLCESIAMEMFKKFCKILDQDARLNSVASKCNVPGFVGYGSVADNRFIKKYDIYNF